MELTIKEKLAIVKAIDSVIVVDELVHKKELKLLGKLMQALDFDSNFLISARSVDSQQGLQILNALSETKKQDLATMLEDMAKSDGYLHEKETALISEIFSHIGLKKNQKNA